MLGGVAVPPLLDGRDAQGGAVGGAGPGREAGGLYAVIRRMTSSRGAGCGVEGTDAAGTFRHGPNLTLPERSGNPPHRPSPNV